MKCLIPLLMITVVLISCTKEYSCEYPCMNKPPVIDSIDNYVYSQEEFHVSLKGTGDNTWAFAFPQFD